LWEFGTLSLTYLEFVNINLEEDSDRELLGPLRVHGGNHLARRARGGHEVDDHLMIRGRPVKQVDKLN
jgi:hypothetical protein